MNPEPSASTQPVQSLYVEQSPSDLLRDFIACFWQAQGTGHSAIDTYTILPDGCIDVVYQQQDERIRCSAFGTTTRAQTVSIVPEATYFGIRFQPGMARYFLDMAALELTDNSADFPRLLDIDSIEIAEYERFTRRQSRIERSLIRRLIQKDLRLTPFDLALGYARRHCESIRVDDLAAICRLSPRQLERKTLDSVGLSPKFFLRILRVQTATATAKRDPSRSLADVALELGFHDQAHMNRDFRLLTGQPPTYYRSAPDKALLASNLASLTVSGFSKT